MRRTFGTYQSHDSTTSAPLSGTFGTSAPSKPRKDNASLLDTTNPFFSGITRFGIDKYQKLTNDPFHTLLNLPWYRFIGVFFCTYISQMLLFSFLYWAHPSHCIHGLNGHFSHALWVSSRTSSTLGFNEISPNPDCPTVNLTVMLQVITSSLIDFIMLGVVFARFSAPFKRASSIRFSSSAVVNRLPSGQWAFKLKVANERKHQILNPNMKMLLTAIDSITPDKYVFEYLQIEQLDAQQTNIQLGFPATLTHVIQPGSPLYNLSLEEMRTRMMEIIVFVDGVDSMTSKMMQARKAYSADDIKMNEQFLDMHLELRAGRLGLDFSKFDVTTCATSELVQEYQSNSSLRAMSVPEVQTHLAHLRHSTFRKLTEAPMQSPSRAAAAAGAAAGRKASGSGVAAAPALTAATGNAADLAVVQLVTGDDGQKQADQKSDLL